MRWGGRTGAAGQPWSLPWPPPARGCLRVSLAVGAVTMAIRLSLSLRPGKPRCSFVTQLWEQLKVKECLLPPFCCFGGHFVKGFPRARQLVFAMEKQHLHAADGWLCSQRDVPEDTSKEGTPGASLPRRGPTRALHPPAAHRWEDPAPELGP